MNKNLSAHRFSNLNLPAPYLGSKKVKLWVAGGVALFVFLILFLLEPFGQIVHGFTLSGILRIGSYALVVGLTLLVFEFWLAPLMLQKWPQESRIKPLIWYLLELLAVTTAIYLCKNAWLEFNYLSFQDYLVVLQRTLSIAVFPLILLLLYIYIRKAPVSNRLVLRAETKAESLSLDPNHLVYLKSEDNYTGVYYLKEEQVQHKLLRGSLNSFEKQLTYPNLRVHRSFIINLAHVESVKGNSQGYQLGLNKTEAPIKVSRKYRPAFEQAWSQFNG